MTKLVLFDCDGVLINTEEIGYNILSSMFEREDIHYTRTEYVEMLSGIGYKEFLENVRRDYKVKKGHDLPESFEVELSTRLHDAHETELKALDGIKELLQKLRTHNIPYAVCSNSSAGHLLYKLKKAGLYEDFVPHIYSRDHVDNSKPAPDIYLHAAKNRGVSPKDCIVVEDSITGAMAGMAAKMKVIGFVGEAHRDDSEADLLLDVGVNMIALSPEQIWRHVVDFANLTPKTPFMVEGFKLPN